MPRKRMIDPEFWSDEEIGRWSHGARLLYIALWNFADDEGRFKANATLLKSQVFPYDRNAKMVKYLQEIESKVILYNSSGSQYGYIRNFSKHQRIDRPTLSRLPEPPKLDEPSPNPQRVVPANIREVNISKDKLSKVPYEDIIDDLNSLLKTQYKPTSEKTRLLIRARWNEGFRLEDFKKVHRNKSKEWGESEEWAKYLRPQTLYGTKFEGYLNVPQKKEKPKDLRYQKTVDKIEADKQKKLDEQGRTD